MENERAIPEPSPAIAAAGRPRVQGADLPADLVRRVPPQLWSGLDETQRRLLISTLSAARTRHALDFRVSIDTIFWGPWYVTIFAGRERRNKARLAAEGQTAPSRQGGFVMGLALLLVTYALFGIFTFAYLMKSLIGLDVSDEASVLHPLYDWFLGR